MKDRNSSLDIPLLAITNLAATTKQVPSDSIFLYMILATARARRLRIGSMMKVA